MCGVCELRLTAPKPLSTANTVPARLIAIRLHALLPSSSEVMG